MLNYTEVFYGQKIVMNSKINDFSINFYECLMKLFVVNRFYSQSPDLTPPRLNIKVLIDFLTNEKTNFKFLHKSTKETYPNEFINCCIFPKFSIL